MSRIWAAAYKWTQRSANWGQTPFVCADWDLMAMKSRGMKKTVGSVGDGSAPANHDQPERRPNTRQPIRVPAVHVHRLACPLDATWLAYSFSPPNGAYQRSFSSRGFHGHQSSVSTYKGHLASSRWALLLRSFLRWANSTVHYETSFP